MQKSEFIDVNELAVLTGFAVSTIRNAHLLKRGPLSPILCKLGARRLGCWRRDFDVWVSSQRRLKERGEQHAVA